MPDSSILGGERAQRRAAGRDTDALGPSDSSDSGSDIQGERSMPTAPDQPDELGAMPVDADADSDRSGTGERGSATGDVVDSADILPDRIEGDPTLIDREFADDPQNDLLDPDDLAVDVSDPEDDAAVDGDEADLEPSPQRSSKGSP